MRTERRNIRRIIALVLAVCMTAVILLSVYFMIRHVCHHCVDKGCSICLEMREVSRKLKSLGNAGASAGWDMALRPLGGFGLCLILVVYCLIGQTPILLKVRMNH